MVCRVAGVSFGTKVFMKVVFGLSSSYSWVRLGRVKSQLIAFIFGRCLRRSLIVSARMRLLLSRRDSRSGLILNYSVRPCLKKFLGPFLVRGAGVLV